MIMYRGLCAGVAICGLSLFPVSLSAEDSHSEGSSEIREVFQSAGQEIREAAQEAGEEIREAAQEIKEEISEFVCESCKDNESSSPEKSCKKELYEIQTNASTALADAQRAVNEMERESMQTLEEVRDKLEDPDWCDDYSRQSRSSGGSGVFATQMLFLDKDPIEQLVTKDIELKRFNFDIENPVVPMMGGIGYYDIGNGTRLGMGGFIGYQKFQSETHVGTHEEIQWQTSLDALTGLTDSIAVDTTFSTRDSMGIVRIVPMYMGFHFEKAVHLEPFDVFAGGFIGGGGYVAHRKFYDLQEESFFYSEEDTVEFEEDFGAFAFAPVAVWDVHAGISYSFAPLFRVGIEGFALFNYGAEGFGTGYGDFFSISPGLRVRFSIGKHAPALKRNEKA